MKNLSLALVALLVVSGLSFAQVKTQEDISASWVKTLIAKMDAKDESIARSVDSALAAMGDKALPALTKVAASEGSKAERARRLVERIKNPRRGGRGGRGGSEGGRGGRGGGEGGRGGRGGPARASPHRW